MTTKLRIAVLVPTLILLVTVACLWPSDITLYAIVGCTLGLFVLAAWWELHQTRKRKRLLPRMFFPSNPEASASAPQVFMSNRELWGYPPKREQVMEEVLSGDEVGGGWNFAVHIHESAEQYLGTAQFSDLADRFASISGVDECKHEDREVFLIRSKSLGANALREACWIQFMAAAKTVFENDKS